jgi:hypothetical protein
MTAFSRGIFAALLFIAFSSQTILAQDSLRTFNVGFLYPLSNQGSASGKYSYLFSLHAIAGVSKGERAFAAAGIANIVHKDAAGFKAAGITNIIGGHADGFTAAGILNRYRTASGFQAAGIANIAADSINGFQSSGFINMAGNVHGAQSAGFINMAGDVHGAQMAGFVNTAGDVHGAQLAGFINLANHVRGAQIGVINIAASNEYPIGLVNIIKDGEKAIGITTDDNLTTLLSLRSGSRKLYGILGVGSNFKNEREVLAIQAGLGAHLISRTVFRLNAELTSTMLENYKKENLDNKGDFNKYALAVLPAFRFGKFELFAGPSFNLVVTDSKEGQTLVDNYIWDHTTHANKLVGFYVGYVGGVQMKF